MYVMRDVNGRDVVENCHVSLLRVIEMERLFAGYAAALHGAPVPRDLTIGDEGRVVALEQDDEPMALVEFAHDGKLFWRGALRSNEIACQARG